MSAQHTPGPRVSYLVAITGPTCGAITQIFARDQREAELVGSASGLDWFNEDCEAVAFDTGARVGLHFEGDPAYIRAAIAKATGAAS